MKFLLNNQESQRLIFRKVKLSDYDEWLEFHKNPLSSQYWIADFESPEKECEKWYERQFFRYQNDLGGMNALIEKKSQRLIGHCGLLVQEVDHITELEVGYSILPEFWKRGFATESARKCMDFAFQNDLSDSIISIISITNIPSEKVALKNGMRIDKVTEYKRNKVNIFRITKSEWNSNESLQ